MFNVQDSLGPDAREQAITAWLATRPYRPVELDY